MWSKSNSLVLFALMLILYLLGFCCDISGSGDFFWVYVWREVTISISLMVIGLFNYLFHIGWIVNHICLVQSSPYSRNLPLKGQWGPRSWSLRWEVTGVRTLLSQENSKQKREPEKIMKDNYPLNELFLSFQVKSGFWKAVLYHQTLLPLHIASVLSLVFYLWAVWL
jgi:hypothetical protein